MPKDRPVSHWDHRLGNAFGNVSNASAKAPAEQNDFHLQPFGIPARGADPRSLVFAKRPLRPGPEGEGRQCCSIGPRREPVACAELTKCSIPRATEAGGGVLNCQDSGLP